LAPNLNDLLLERREVLTLIAFHATVTPQILFPPNGVSRTVFVTGDYRDTDTKSPAQANYQVVDEYRIDQPIAKVASHAVPGQPGFYTFAFKTHLQAQVASSDSNGRLYTMALAVTDSSGSVGQSFGIWVPPAGYHPPKPKPHAQTANALSQRGHLRRH
jgi:hypothetical protein